MPNFTRMLSSKFWYAKISKYGTFKFKDFSRTFKDFSRTLWTLNTGRGRGQVPTLVAHLMWHPTPLIMLPRQPLSACDQTENSVSIYWQYRRCRTIWAFRLADDDQPCRKLWQSPGCIHQFGDLLPCLRRSHEQIPLAGFRKNVLIGNCAEVSIECCEYWRGLGMSNYRNGPQRATSDRNGNRLWLFTTTEIDWSTTEPQREVVVS